MSSDSSDDENLELLKEAVDSEFINNDMYSDSKPKDKIKEPKEKKLPSLRSSKIDEDEQFNLFRTTPEFRKHVAKHLTKLLDEKLQKEIKIAKEFPETIENKKKRKKNGIKLLKSSERFLKLSKNCEEPIPNNILQPTINKDRYKKLQINLPENGEELLKEVSVSIEDIKKEVKSWSKRSKAPVFNYKKNNRILTLVEPKFQ